MLTRGAHDERAGDIYTAAGANVGEMGDDMGVRSKYDFGQKLPKTSPFQYEKRCTI